MNQTTSHPPPAPRSGHEFTQGNLIVLFLALFLCLLVQPWGSLVYRPLGDTWPRYTRIIFFIWRCNPFACVAEAVIIGICFVDSLLQLRRQFLGSGLKRKLTWSDISRALHTTSIALLLLRGNDDTGGDVEVVLEERLDSLVIPEPVPSDSTGPEPAVAENDLETDALLAHDEGQVSAEKVSQSESSSHYKANRKDDSNLRRRGTSELEKARSPDDEDDNDISSNSPKLQPSQIEVLGQFLTPNTSFVLQKSKLLDIITTFTTLFITVVLITTSFPWPFRLVAAFHLLGWYSVKTLLTIYDHYPLSSSTSSTSSIISRAKRIRDILSKPLAYTIIHLFTIPFLAYLTYQISWTVVFFTPNPENQSLSNSWPQPPTFPGVTIPNGIYHIDDGTLPSIIFWTRVIFLVPLGSVIIYVAFFVGFVIGFFFLPTAFYLLVVTFIFTKPGDIQDTMRLASLPIFFLQVIGLCAALDKYPDETAVGFLWFVILSVWVGVGVVLWGSAAGPYRFRKANPVKYTELNKLIPVPDAWGAAFWGCWSCVYWVYLFGYAVQYYDDVGSERPRWLEYWG